MRITRPSLNPPTLNPNWSESTTQPAKSIAGNVSHTFGPTLQWDTTAGFSMFSQNLIYSTNGKNDINEQHSAHQWLSH